MKLLVIILKVPPEGYLSNQTLRFRQNDNQSQITLFKDVQSIREELALSKKNEKPETSLFNGRRRSSLYCLFFNFIFIVNISCAFCKSYKVREILNIFNIMTYRFHHLKSCCSTEDYDL